ncbi:TonB-dependent receptor plug domain-containing protein [Chryseobacterium sp.]|uniref:TonB-dependent receptor plug domain-containing protein n=1 Tax=Chryseobacterium sp. TaxID=1871047 RepID=UPI00289A1A92|nr:TonB-dependent receptor plug domain-containing protein [Chryseobacterium sp.]
MNFKFPTYIFLLVFLLCFSAKAQQFDDFKKEKTYIQTSHVFYKPGEMMYFKISVLDAETNLPTTQSKVVNFEIANPSGAIVSKQKIEIKNGTADGNFHFNEELSGGIYKIRAFTAWMQNEAGKNVFEKEITLQKIVSPRILMKLDFLKKGYGAGDEVIADFSMRSLSNLPIPFYEATFTAMHDGEKISEGSLITDKEGKYLLKFKLPEVLKSSDALLTIKVNFDGFTESISRNIPIVLNNLDLKFMPEGGTFINGTEQNLAFKITDEFEKPVDAVLAIFNQNHQKITEVSAYNFGMGNFLFTPRKGETYYAKVLKPENISKIYQLPEAKDEGVLLNILKENESLKISIHSTSERNVSVKGSFREKEVYAKDLMLKKGFNQIEISEKEFPVGICRFTVFENEIPLAERIVFTNENKQLKVKMTPVKKNYLPREKVVVDIETLDENNKPIPANLGVSVVDDKLWTYADDKQNHILSWLLVDSELKGKIEKPQFYFDKKEEKAPKSLDLVMLTNGYRYFELSPEVLTQKKYKFLPEKRNPIYGIVEDEDKNPVKSEVYLLENKNLKKQITSENGLFYFTDLSAQYQHKIIAKPLDKNKKVKVRLLSFKLQINPLEKQNLKNIDVEEIIKEAEIKEKTKTTEGVERLIRNRPSVNSRADTIKAQQDISEVVMIGYGVRKKEVTGAVQTVVSNDFNNQNAVMALSGRVAGLEISAGNPGSQDKNVLIRGNSSVSNTAEPLYVIDGVVASSSEFKSLNAKTINNISILKDAAATSVYGSRASNGVIIINSVNNRNGGVTFNITPKSQYTVYEIPRDSLTYYSYSRKFSYPEYKSTITPYRHDYRETLYWNPTVETDKNGKAQIEFYQSDASSAFRIITEGISAKGLIGRDETTYSAQSLISIDAKMPQYLTRTDKILIPVVVKNNSPETRTLHLSTIVPNYIKLIKADSSVTLKPLESGRLFVEMQSDKLIRSNIQFTLKSGDFRETMILPLQVEEKGFPHKYSMINNKNENVKITVPEIINGSLYSSYYVYENSALQMFEDLERLKEEPYGCFEQLSSTVYPNIFILDYLKSVKKIKPQNEAAAIKSMKKGFQKMLSYKNYDGGFSYFGGSESDVALSALALLEFNNLKKYVAIEPKLIQKLSDFILSKKNSTGLFEVRRSYEINKPLTEFAWSRNMYVLYALSKLGYKNEIQTVFDTNMKRVLATKDSYQLALMANASYNLERKEEYQKLMSVLNDQYKNKEVKTKSTFTGSAGVSANSEMLSLYMMALQKDEKANQLAIAEVADELINNNGYYGFGSTQATALALETLSDFFAKNEQLFGNEKPQIKINGAEVKADLSISSAYRTGDNVLEVFYPKQRGLPYKLKYEYYTLQAPKSENIPVTLETKLNSNISKVGETNRMTVTVKNKINGDLPMTTAKIGIPAGLTLQNALLKDMMDKKQVSYYEIFDNYLVLYWEHFDANETKTINLDLKVEFAGEYTGKASNVYLYYMPESKFWNEGIKAKIEP